LSSQLNVNEISATSSEQELLN